MARSWWDENAPETNPDNPYQQPEGGGTTTGGGTQYGYDQQFADKVQEWYKTYLGRSASDQEIQQHWGNPGTKAGKLPDVFEVIKNSPEATAYAASQKVTPSTTGNDSPYTGGYTNLSELGNLAGQSGVWEGRFDFPTYTPPTFDAGSVPGAEVPVFDAPTFTAPTAESVLSDAGVQARLKLGEDAIQRSAAAKGTLLTSGTLKGLNQYAQDYGSSEYEKAFARALQDFQTAYGGKWDEYQSRFNASGTNYSRAKDEYDAKYNTAANTYGAAKDKYTQAYSEWLAADTNKFSRLYNLASLGANASGSMSIGA